MWTHIADFDNRLRGDQGKCDAAEIRGRHRYCRNLAEVREDSLANGDDKNRHNYEKQRTRPRSTFFRHLFVGF